MTHRTPYTSTLAQALRLGIGLGVTLNTVLIGLGLFLVPTTLTASDDSIVGVGAAIGILFVYGLAGLLGVWATDRANTQVLRLGVLFGLFVGAVFALEIVLEYVILPADNTGMGLLEYGAVLLLLLVAGVLGAYQTRHIRFGILTAIWSALIGLLIWFSTLFIVHYAFLGTPQQTQVLAAEGTFEDFRRSGMTDLPAFVMQDLLGGGFFHLLLGPIVATVLGAVGGLIGKGLTQLRPSRGQQQPGTVDEEGSHGYGRRAAPALRNRHVGRSGQPG
jgi:hypothetical protein